MYKKISILVVLAVVLTGMPTRSYAVMEDYPSVKLQGLDKSVGRTVTFEAKVGSTIQYGPLFVKIHACRKAPPIEQPESAAFLQIWEVPPGEEKSEWVFSGWMFASSPALSAMDHPVYDVWVLDCTGREEPNEAAQAAESDEVADQDTLGMQEEKPAPSEETPVIDSEAEDQSPPTSSNEATEAAPIQGEVENPAPPAQSTDVPVTSQPDPEGFTAYDLMKQGTPSNSVPQPENVENQPIPTDSAPQSPIY